MVIFISLYTPSFSRNVCHYSHCHWNNTPEKRRGTDFIDHKSDTTPHTWLIFADTYTKTNRKNCQRLIGAKTNVWCWQRNVKPKSARVPSSLGCESTQEVMSSSSRYAPSTTLNTHTHTTLAVTTSQVTPYLCWDNISFCGKVWHRVIYVGWNCFLLLGGRRILRFILIMQQLMDRHSARLNGLLY